MTQRIREFLRNRREDGPCVVVDLEVVRDNYSKFARALPDTRVFYAVKANPEPQVLKLLAELGSCFDTASVVEIQDELQPPADVGRPGPRDLDDPPHVDHDRAILLDADRRTDEQQPGHPHDEHHGSPEVRDLGPRSPQHHTAEQQHHGGRNDHERHERRPRAKSHGR